MTENTVRVWDLAVRIFHWSLVVFFTVSYLTGDELDTIHAYSGYVVLGLVAFRLVWGFIGTRHARFMDFVYGPARVREYLKSLLTRHPKHYLGHNPAGGWMVIALLVSITLTGISGLKLYGIEGHGPLAGNGPDISLVSTAYADDERDDKEGDKPGEEFWEDIHEFFADLSVILVFIHIAGVLVSSMLHGENLVRAMVTGNKRSED
jgi:cytochrome b